MISLQTLRHHKHVRWPLYFLFGLIIISFVFFYGWRSDPNADRPQVVFGKIRSDSWNPFRRWETIGPEMIVDGENWQVQRKARLLPQQIMQFLNSRLLRDLVSTPEKAEGAANLLLAERAGKKMGISTTSDDIVAYLRQQPGISQQAVEAAARESRYTSTDQFLEYLRLSMLADHTEALVGQVAHASLFELWQEYQLANEKISLTLAAYPVKEMESQVAVTEQDLTEYLSKHKPEFHVPAKRLYAYAKFSKLDLRNKTVPTDDQIRAYYDQHQTDYQVPAGVKVEELLIPLHQQDPTTYAQHALAMLESIRKEAAVASNWTSFSLEVNNRKPEMLVLAAPFSPWLTAESPGYSADYLMAARTMTGDGPSTPVQDNARAVMFRVKERRAAGVSPLDQIREQVKNSVIEETVKKTYADTNKAWRAEAGKYKQIGDFAKAMAVNDELSTPTAVEEEYIPGLGSIPRGNLRDYLAALRPGELSEVFDTGDTLAAVQMRSQSDAYDPPLAEVRAKVEEAFRREKAVELARLRAEQILQVVRGGADIKTALADAPVKPLDAPPFQRGETITALEAPLLNFNQDLAGLKEGSAGMSPYGQNLETPLGYAVWKVTSIAEPTRDQFAKDRYQFERDYLTLAQTAVISEWLADQRKKAEFTIETEEK